MSHFTPGQILSDKFRVLSVLGQGAMGTVYRVEHLLLRVPVALKVLASHLASRPDQVERFLREGAAVSRVRHRAVVQVLDAGMHGHLPWIAMELLEGETLRARMARGPMSPAETIAILSEVVHGLGASHEQGIVHRDVKPANIILAHQPDGTLQPKLLDFGIALVMDAQERLTGAGMMMGTLHYMAPEQLHAARDADGRADLYSVGAMLFEALTGRPPYQASSAAQLLATLAQQPVPDALSLAPHQPRVLAEIATRCLARDREARPRDARQLAALLDAAARMPEAQAGVLPSTLVIPGLEQSRPGAQSSAPIDPLGPTAPRTPSSSGAPGHAPGSWPGHVGGGTVALSPQWPAGGGSSPGHGAPQWPAGGGSSPGQSAAPWQGGSSGGPAPGSWPGAQSWPGAGSQPAQPLWPGEDPFAQPPKRSGLWHLAWIAPLGVVLLGATAFGVVKALEASEDDEEETTRPSASVPSTTSAMGSPPPPPPTGVMLPVQQPAAAPVAPSPPPVPPVPVGPTPVPVGTTSPPSAGTEPPRAHACVGTWQGSLYQSDGQTGTSVVSIDGASGPCGSFVERWASGSVCHYRLLSCTTSGNVLSASARTPSYEQCSPVRMRFTCESGRMRFHESAPGVTVTSTMSRR